MTGDPIEPTTPLPDPPASEETPAEEPTIVLLEIDPMALASDPIQALARIALEAYNAGAATGGEAINAGVQAQGARMRIGLQVVELTDDDRAEIERQAIRDRILR